ncbi:MAG TPA: flagellar motor switch protein FliM [Gammaproteobacteria bacterium]|nr:flagellar motor switch protein FliM [Gammaproteobacteria bacterium]
MKDILSQDEIDALLHGVDSGDVESETDAPVDIDTSEIKVYDFANQDRIVRGRLPTLEMINERFVRYFRTSIYNMIRKPIEINPEGVSMVKYGEYNQGLFVPTSLSLIKAHPLRGTGLIMIDPKLVFSIVDNFFGGSGRYYNKIEGRDFTPTEHRVIRLVVDCIFGDMQRSWESVHPLNFEYLSHEVNPNMATIVNANEIVVVSSFSVELDGGGGPLQITLPFSLIEPIRDKLDAGIQSDRADTDDRWNEALRQELMQVEIEMDCKLAELEMTVRQLANLKAGDILAIDEPGLVLATVEGIPVLRGKYGKSAKGQAAIAVDKLIVTPPEESEGPVEPNKTLVVKENTP